MEAYSKALQGLAPGHARKLRGNKVARLELVMLHLMLHLEFLAWTGGLPDYAGKTLIASMVVLEIQAEYDCHPSSTDTKGDDQDQNIRSNLAF